MIEMSSATVAARQPSLHVAIIAALGIGDSEQEAFGAVKLSSAQHVGAKEREQAMTNAGQKGDATPSVEYGAGARRRVSVNSGQRVFELQHRMVDQRWDQTTDRSLAQHPLVNRNIGKMPAAPTEQPQDVSGTIPSGGWYAHRSLRGGGIVADVALRRERRKDGSGEVGIYMFVGIHRYDPLTPSLRQREFFREPKPVNSCSKTRAPCSRASSAVRSVLTASTTIRSSQNLRLSKQVTILAASFLVITIALSRTSAIP